MFILLYDFPTMCVFNVFMFVTVCRLSKCFLCCRLEELFYREKRMPCTSTSKVDLKTQKRRRRSLDESLINPIKAFVVSARLRRQSTTDATNLERSIFYSSDKRRRQSEHEYFSKLPIQDTTKERLMSAVSKSSSLEDNDNNKKTPKMFQRLSRHLARQSFSENAEEKRRNSIHEIPKDSNEMSSSETPDSFQHFRKQFDRMSLDATSLSTVDSGVEIRDEKTGSSEDTERSDDGDSLDGITRDKLLSAQGATLINRSLSTNDVANESATETDKNSDATMNSSMVHRQYSFREECSNNVPFNVLPSPMVIRTSQEKLNLIRSTASNDEKIQAPSNNNFNSRGSLRKKKKLLQPLVDRLRKTSRSESFDRSSPKLTTLDGPGMEKIVSEILREKMRGLEYDHSLSKDRCRMISTTIEKTLKVRLMAQPGYPEYKIVALVYIAETKDNGIFFATQCSYQPSDDLFATATYQNDEMYVCTTVLATLLPKTS